MRLLFLCIGGTLLCWGLAALNAWLYLRDGSDLSAFAAVWCACMATWTTHSTIGMYFLYRDQRDRYRSTIR
jgi:hypothetical protein